jgi:O-Antigen ligase
VFYLIVINCRTKRHLKMLVTVLLVACFFVIFMGSLSLLSGDETSPYLLHMHNDEGDTFLRLNGLGFINDPNDFGQVLACLIPCLFFFWRPKRNFLNTIFVIIPAGLLIFGMFLTHSRGAMLALLGIIVVSARRKIGTVPSVVIAGCLFVVTLAAGWSGGRDVSVGAGADRMDAWSAGLEMMKEHPVFGVGFNDFTEHYTLTAHNTIVVCAAELGLVGLYLWLLFVSTAFWQAMALGGSSGDKQPAKEEETLSYHGGGPATWIKSSTVMHKAFATVPAGSNVAHVAMANPAAMMAPAQASPNLEDAESDAVQELRRLARLMVISLAGFLVAGWFLSRALQMTIFVLGGMVEVIYQLGVKENIVPARIPIAKLMRFNFLSVIGVLLLVYIMLRVEHMMGIH